MDSKKGLFISLLLIVGLLFAALPTGTASADSTITLYSSDATALGADAISTDHFTGRGAWSSNNATIEFYVSPSMLGLSSIQVDAIDSIVFRTKNGTAGGVDWGFYIYTDGTKYGWYEERLISEPMYSVNYNGDPADTWNTWDSEGTTNQIAFYDSHYSDMGFYYGPTLADLKAGAIDWSTYPTGTGTTPIDYGAQFVKFFKFGTGSAWSSTFAGLLDTIEFKISGVTYTIDLEDAQLLTTYVDDSWTGLAIGVDPDGAGPALEIGYDAFSVIQDGINAVLPGGTVHVAAGEYDENLTITKALTLLGAGDDVVTVNGVAPTSDVGMLNIGASDVTVEGFKFVGEGYKTIRITAPTSDVTLRNNTVIGAATTVGGWSLLESNYAAVQTDLTIDGNTFEGHGQQQLVYLNPTTPGLVLTGNTFQGDPTSGPVLGIDGMDGTQTISGNTFDIDSTYALFEGFGTLNINTIFGANTWPAGYIASGKMVVPSSVVYPSTNDINRTNGWAHVDFVSADAVARTMTFNMIQPRAFYACFEYRTNLQTVPTDPRPNWNAEVLDGMWTYTCLSTVGSTLKTIPLLNGATSVEFRHAFGGEKDERFYWTPFTFVADVWVDDDYTSATPGWGVDHFLTIQEAVDAVAARGTVNVLPGTYPGGVVVNKNGLTINLNGATVGHGTPAFTIAADDITINGPGTLAGDGLSAGILVNAGSDNFILDGVEITGWTDGVNVAGAVESLKIVNNWIHTNTESALEVVGTPTGVVTIEGNLFKENTGVDVVYGGAGTLDVTYNSWGAITGPAGLATNVGATPFNYYELYFDTDPTTPAVEDFSRRVYVGQTFDVALKADAVNVYGLSFKFTYDPAKLVLNLTTFDAAWLGKCAVVGTPATGTVEYRCNLVEPDLEWQGGTIATFNFTSIASGDAALDVFADETVSAGAVGGVKVWVNNAGYNDPSDPDRDLTDPIDGLLYMDEVANFTGFIDLQGRPNDSGALLKVYEDSIGTVLLTSATSASSGKYTTTYAPGLWMVDSTVDPTYTIPYYLLVDRALFLPTVLTTKSLTNTPLTTLAQLLLLGGDADNNDVINSVDAGCIGGAYGTAGNACGAGLDDVNEDGIVNIYDLTLMAGNYTLTFSPWAP